MKDCCAECKYLKVVNKKHLYAECEMTGLEFLPFGIDTRNRCCGRFKRKQIATKMKIKLDDGAKMPTRAHETDAGLDLYARETQIIPAKESAVFDTGVHVELPLITVGDQTFKTVGMVKSKSGLNVKFGLQSEGVIDVGYTGSIVVKLYNHSGYDYKVNAGDKISQLVIMPILTPPLELVESLDDTERGAGGFGSTGK